MSWPSPPVTTSSTSRLRPHAPHAAAVVHRRRRREVGKGVEDAAPRPCSAAPSALHSCRRALGGGNASMEGAGSGSERHRSSEHHDALDSAAPARQREREGGGGER